MTVPTGNYRENLYSALKEYRAGNFYMGGALTKFISPGLVVEGLGPIEFPLSSTQAKELASVCSRQNSTNDNSTGSYLQLLSNKFSLTEDEWTTRLRFLVNNEVTEGLGILDTIAVVPELDRLLLLQEGDSVPPHFDKDKEVWGRHLGTLVIVLPSSHLGGGLHVRHAGQPMWFPFVRDYQGSPLLVHYAAHYAECEQEFFPVERGNQLLLLYNLSYKGVREPIQPPDNSRSVANIREAMMAWSVDLRGPQKMVVPLEDYFIMGKRLPFETIRDFDRAKVEAFLHSSQTPDGPLFHAYLATLAERQVVIVDDDNDDVILESSGVLENLLAPKGQTAPWRKMSFKKEEILLEMLDEPEFFDERVLAVATEDQGKRVERWGSKGAIVVWPHSKRWDIALTENADKALQHTAALIKSVQSARDALEDACISGCRLSAGEAATVLNAVMEHGRLPDLEELRCAMKAVQQAELERLTSAQVSQLAKIIEADAKSLRLMEERPGDPRSVLMCAFCKSTAEKKGSEKLRKCGRCHLPFYCGIQCQKAHGKLHKPYCQAAAG